MWSIRKIHINPRYIFVRRLKIINEPKYRFFKIKFKNDLKIFEKVRRFSLCYVILKKIFKNVAINQDFVDFSQKQAAKIFRFIRKKI